MNPAYRLLTSLLFLSAIVSLCINQALAQCPSALNFDITGQSCTERTLLFENISSSSPGGSYVFFVEDTVLSTAPYAYSFTSVGIKEVILQRTDPGGCIDSLTKTIEIYPSPTADFGHNSTNESPPCSQTPVEFFDQSIPASGLSYSWNFGEGHSSTTRDPTVLLNAFGNGTADLNVSLTVAGEDGCTDQIIKTVSVLQRPRIELVDEFGFAIEQFQNCENATSDTPGFEISYTDQSSPAGISYRVNYGDGSPEYNGSVPDTSHIYTDLGIYTITYEVTGSNGCTARRAYQVFNISNPSIGGGNPGSSVGCAPLDLTFPISGFENNDQSTIYEIDPGDGSDVIIYNHPPPTDFPYTYTTTSCGLPDNSFVFSITARNGCKSTTWQTSGIEVYITSLANIGLTDSTFCINQLVTFENNTLLGRNNNCSSNTKFDWDFGNGQTLEVLNSGSVTQQYDEAGDYEVILKATNYCGSDSTSSIITICDRQPASEFTIVLDDVTTTSTEQCGDESIELELPDGTCSPLSLALNSSFVIESCEEKISWAVISASGEYEFQNGEQTSDNTNEVITFSMGGSYIIQQTVQNVCGIATSCIRVNLDDPPEPPQIVLEDHYCEEDTITLHADYDNSINEVQWTVTGISGTPDPGALPDLNVQEPKIVIPPGSYEISISVSNGCSSSFNSDTIVVNEYPAPVISGNDSTAACQDEIILLTVNGEDDVIYTWQKDFVDIPNSNNDTLEVRSSGIYQVIADRNGCSSTSNEIALNFNTAPEVPEITMEANYCEGDTTTLLADYGENVIEIQWMVEGTDGTPDPDALPDLTVPEPEMVLPPGIYNISFSVSNDCGSMTDSISIVVNEYHDVAISSEDSTTACQGEIIVLSATAMDNVVYTWQKDSIEIPNSNNTTYEASSSGTYRVIADRNGCESTSNYMSLSFVQGPEPIISTDNGTLLCHGDSVDITFFVNSEDEVDYQWFKDDLLIVDAIDTLLHTDEAGRYHVVATTPICEVSSNNIIVSFYPEINPDYNFEAVYCQGSEITFNNTTIIPDGTNLVFRWDFGDGSAAGQLTNGIHAYNSSGIFNVVLSAAIDSNICMTQVMQAIEIVDPVVADFEIIPTPGDYCGPLVADFENQSTGHDLSYTWDFGNGDTSTEEDPFGILYRPGIFGDTSYVVTLQVESGASLCAAAQHTETLTVKAPPIARFLLAKDEICAEYPLDMNNYSLGVPDYYIWDFGDGSPTDSTIRGGTIEHAFPYDGFGDTTYHVSLTAVNECGVDILNLPIKVTAINVDAFFNVDVDDGCAPLEVNFTSNQASLNNSLVWDWGDPTGNTTTGGIGRSHVFEDAGTYRVELTVQNGCNIDSYLQEIEVLQSPEVDFSMADQVCVDQELAITNTSPQPVGSSWDFGNGGPQYIGANPPAPIYDSEGTYYVTLVITDQLTGCSSSKAIPVEVIPLPVPQFSFSPDICPGAPLTVENNSAYASTYEWQFNEDGPKIYGNTVTNYTYPRPGSYPITLVAINELGCSDSLTQFVSIQDPADPDFDIQVLSADKNETPLVIEIINTTTVPPEGNGTFEWVLPDGTTRYSYTIDEELTLLNFTDTAQLNYVQLTAATQFGCEASIVKSIEVQPLPCNERLALPTIFTPNGDGKNDVLRSLIRKDMDTYRPIVASDIVLGYKMEVYSRWGELIFQSVDPTIGWNGNGFSEDIYIVLVSFQCKFNGGGTYEPQEVLLKH